MSLSQSKCWYSNNCLHFLKHAVPLEPTEGSTEEVNKINKIGNNYVVKLVTFIKYQNH
jgi:hypothetical protein